ncbi:aldolase [Pseudooceanicola sp. CBS1P-1]|uniref:Aldolase n=1 Tax=Pseudooceanicola albus TaxID=2692189 RepID=A0A6L7G9L6_9RHOB|nr:MULTISPECIES: aldolase/citrate lyase family protein [Pseudooceanicola]MBT9386645.1 aldolase [Pseudooceanicola endophyticus]MXN20761.1 aldolase [Pseudooceanicola albus]
MQLRSNDGQSENTGSAAFGLAFCLLGRAESVLLARGAGFDFVVIDMEHGPIALGDMAQAAAAARAAGLPLWGRVTGPAAADVARVLDCGASGVVVPHVDSAAQARHVAGLCRFAPRGRRALPGPLPALDYRVVAAGPLCREAEQNTQVIAMIESAAGLSEVEAIAAVPGIDMLMIGSNDLADGLGHRGDLAHPQVRAAFARIAAAARAAGIGFGVMGLPGALLRSHALDLGATAIVATNETNLIVEAGAALLKEMRGMTA